MKTFLTDCKHDRFRTVDTKVDGKTWSCRRLEWCSTCGELLYYRSWPLPPIVPPTDKPCPPPGQIVSD